MTVPRIGCIIPVKDRKHMAAEAVESVFSQSIRVDEVIIVDDGSRDGTPAMLHSRFPEARIVLSCGMGPGRARNLGAMLSRSEVLMFLDSDDIWLSNHVKDLLGPLLGGLDCSFGVTVNSGPCINDPFTLPGDEFRPDQPIFNNLLRWCCMVPSAFAVKREKFARTGGFPSMSMGEDWIFFARAAQTLSFAFVPVPVTLRRIHEDNLCWRKFSNQSAVRMLQHIKVLALKAGLRKDARRIERIELATIKRRKKWGSVQEWYLYLKSQGLI